MVAKTTRGKGEKIVSWKLVLTTESGRDIDIADIPDDVAQVMDSFITEDIEGGADHDT